MSCDRQVLSSYRDGELSPEHRREVDAHLLICTECREVLRRYTEISHLMRSLPIERAPASLGADLRFRIMENEAERLDTGILRSLTRAVAPAFVGAAAMLTFMVVYRPGAGEPIVGQPLGLAPAAVPAPVAQQAPASPPQVAVAPPAQAAVPRGIAEVAQRDPAEGDRRVLSAEPVLSIPTSINRLYQGSQAVRNLLGPAIPGSRTVTLMEQSFQGGMALWRSDTREIYVMNRQGGTWTAYPDTWKPGGESLAAAVAPPPGAFVPAGGFGNIWQNRPEVKSRLGWAVYEPRGSGGAIQAFEHGFVVWTPHGLLYVLTDDGKWKTFPDASPL